MRKGKAEGDKGIHAAGDYAINYKVTIYYDSLHSRPAIRY